jgi:uncharacterized glyoxalase superfamily protein PhnB
MMGMKITPILFVDAIEPCLPFWVESLGMAKIVEVPEGDRLGFVMLQKDGAELMLQTHESAAKDAPELTGKAQSSIIYVEVEDFPALLGQVKGLEVLLPVRDTFYGMREIAVREPGGNAVCFAARVAE